MIKHFVWNYAGKSGRVAGRVENDVIEVRQISGKAPPWSSMDATCVDWSNIINNAFQGPDGEPLNVWAQNLSATRVNRCAVECRVGMCGAVDYTLRIERNANLADYPIAARLHISMAGKLNSGLKMWLGDYAELKDALNGNVSDETPESGMVIEEVPTRAGLNFYQPEPWPEPAELTPEILELLERV